MSSFRFNRLQEELREGEAICFRVLTGAFGKLKKSR